MGLSVRLFGLQIVDFSAPNMYIFNIRSAAPIAELSEGIELYWVTTSSSNSVANNAHGFLIYSWKENEILDYWPWNSDFNLQEFTRGMTLYDQYINLSPTRDKFYWFDKPALILADITAKKTYLLSEQGWTFPATWHCWAPDGKNIIVQTMYYIDDHSGYELEVINVESGNSYRVRLPLGKWGPGLFLDQKNNVLRTTNGDYLEWNSNRLTSEIKPFLKDIEVGRYSKISPQGNRASVNGYNSPVQIIHFDDGSIVDIDISTDFDVYMDERNLNWLTNDYLYINVTPPHRIAVIDSRTGNVVITQNFGNYEWDRPKKLKSLIDPSTATYQGWFTSLNGWKDYSLFPVSAESYLGEADSSLSSFGGRLRYDGWELTQNDNIYYIKNFPWVYAGGYFNWLYMSDYQAGWQWTYWDPIGWNYISLDESDKGFWAYSKERESWMYGINGSKNPYYFYYLKGGYWISVYSGKRNELAPHILKSKRIQFFEKGNEDELTPEFWYFYGVDGVEIETHLKSPDTGEAYPIKITGTYSFNRIDTDRILINVSADVFDWTMSGILELSYKNYGEGTATGFIQFVYKDPITGKNDPNLDITVEGPFSFVTTGK